jgi:hypothetical protein
VTENLYGFKQSTLLVANRDDFDTSGYLDGHLQGFHGDAYTCSPLSFYVNDDPVYNFFADKFHLEELQHHKLDLQICCYSFCVILSFILI